MPINLSDGSDNLSSSNPVEAVQVIVTYDPNVLTVDTNASDFKLGNLLTSNGGWNLTANPSYSSNTILLIATNPTGGLSGNFSGDAFDLPFTVNAGASGTTEVYVARQHSRWPKEYSFGTCRPNDLPDA